VEILVGECSLYSNDLVQLFLFGVGTAFPHLFFSTAFPHLFLKRCGKASFVETAFCIGGGTGGGRMGLGTPTFISGGPGSPLLNFEFCLNNVK